ncbi:MAG: TrkH family potassium uptake protein [Bacteroidales bacterium]|nr:MAG: TrkH family potassium uptake protein [Bacteroidales bacterium]
MINFKIILKILGLLVLMEGLFMLFGIPFSLYFHEDDLFPILISSLITAGTGGFTWFLTRNAAPDLGKREGYIIVSTAWIFFSFFGSLPFVIGGAIPSFTDAFFETISGFTTTGASILNDIEAMPHGLLLWRSMTQWLGGMGIIVLSIAILPILGIGGMQLFIAEVPGPAPDKLHPRVKETAKRLWAIYIIFTASEGILLMFGGMDLFDAICHSFTTMATGGYSTKQASIACFNSPYIHYVITIFMFLAGTNFTLSYFALHLRFDKVWKNEEFRFYVSFILGFILLVTAGLWITQDNGLEKSFRDAAFQVVSIVTTTGYVTADYLKWMPALGVVILILMFTGGSAGSTGGSIKMVRLLLLFKDGLLELKRLIHPNAVVPVRFNHRVVSTQIISNILAFVVFYMVITGFSVIIMGFLCSDLDTAFGSVAATLGNIGPGIGAVGPAENYFHLPAFGKWFLSFLMLLGRLELFTVLVLFSPSFWKK